MQEFRLRRLSAMKMTVAIGKSVGGSEPILRKQAITVDGLKFFLIVIGVPSMRAPWRKLAALSPVHMNQFMAQYHESWLSNLILAAGIHTTAQPSRILIKSGTSKCNKGVISEVMGKINDRPRAATIVAWASPCLTLVERFYQAAFFARGGPNHDRFRMLSNLPKQPAPYRTSAKHEEVIANRVSKT